MPAHLPLVVGAGITGALLFAAMLALGPLLGMVPGMLSPMPLVAVGLMLGWGAGMGAVIVATVLVTLVSLSPAAGGVYLVSDGVPALLVLWLALRPAPGVSRPDPGRARDWTPVGRILAWLALVPVLGLVVAAVGTAVTGQGLEALVRVGVDRLISGLPAMTASPAGSGSGVDGGALDGATRQQATDMLVSILPGLLAVSWTVRAVVGGVLGQALASRFGRSVRPRPRYAAIRLPLWYGGVFVAALVLAQLGGAVGYVAWAAMLGLTLPFLLLGLKLVHLVARRMPAPGVVLAVFYVVFLSVSAIGYAAMVAVGLVEFATDLRKDAGGRSMEDE